MKQSDLLAENKRLREALEIADDLINLHRDYTTMPAYPDFFEKYQGRDGPKMFSELRRKYTAARSALASKEPDHG